MYPRVRYYLWRKMVFCMFSFPATCNSVEKIIYLKFMHWVCTGKANNCQWESTQLMHMYLNEFMDP